MDQAGGSGLPKTLASAVLQAGALFDTDPSAVEGRTGALVESAPGQPHALALAVSAKRLRGDFDGAKAFLNKLTTEEPNLASSHVELGSLLLDMQKPQAAVAALSRAVELEPNHPEAWRKLGDVLSGLGERQQAAAAYARHFEARCVELREIENAVIGPHDQLAGAVDTLRSWLDEHPTDVSARRMLGSVYIRLRRYDDAEQQLSQVLDLSPELADARWMLAGTFYHRGMWKKTLAEVETLIERAPAKPEYHDLRAYALLHSGESEAALNCYETLLSSHPTAESWRAYGYALKSVGRKDDAIAAYRKAIACKPDYGFAYWSLASLKTFRFDSAEIEAMRKALARPEMQPQNRARLHFALGKALEDEKQPGPSFEQYRQANAIVHATLPYNADETGEFVRRCKQVFTPEFFRARQDWGSESRDPIFVIGLPRSGTTLIEQILASHSQVESTGELQVLDSVAKRISSGASAANYTYPELLQSLERDHVRKAAEDYLALARPYRKLGRPFFVDKMPTNFLHLGLLLLLLPNAKVIDARRHPLGNGFAIFRHYFQDGYAFAFDLPDIGHYCRRYVELMAHFDAVLPGRIHRIHYERMVSDTENEIRKLVDYCALPFEENCLNFHATQRTVLTPSSEQVRQPISAEASQSWHAYEPWLGPLKSALGDVLSLYPSAPDFREFVPAKDMQWSISAPSQSKFTRPLNSA